MFQIIAVGVIAFDPSSEVARRDVVLGFTSPHAVAATDALFRNGFRTLAHVGREETRLVLRRGNVYTRFTELASAIHNERARGGARRRDWGLDANGRLQFFRPVPAPQLASVLRVRRAVAPWRRSAFTPASRAGRAYRSEHRWKVWPRSPARCRKRQRRRPGAWQETYLTKVRVTNRLGRFA